MLTIADIGPPRDGVLTIDEYVPFTFKFSDVRCPHSFLWFSGNLETTMLEVMVNRSRIKSTM